MVFLGNDERERRIFERGSVKAPVRIQFKDPQDFRGSLSADISEGGLQIQIQEFIPLKTELTISMELADNSVVECVGKVVWVEQLPFSESYKIGLKFVDNQSLYTSRSRINQFLESD
jgi:Tfp pilus assembly protein PilZ